MKLIYNKTGVEVKVGDIATDFRGDLRTVTFFREPHKSSSSGKISLLNADGRTSECFVGVIDAAWIDREDR